VGVEGPVGVADAAEVFRKVGELVVGVADGLGEGCGGLGTELVWLGVDCGVVDVGTGGGALTTKSSKFWANKNEQPGALIPSVYVPGIIDAFIVTSTCPSN